jgi:hypothetical protein
MGNGKRSYEFSKIRNSRNCGKALEKSRGFNEGK